jgi:glycyl-tRNA synthetase
MSDWTEAREFNLLFETSVGIVKESESKVYLRGEIAQGMFTNFKNVIQTMRPKLPFGIAQSGKAFRNEITLGNFIFRTLEFNLAEFEYFIDPDKQNWKEVFESWKSDMQKFALSLGLSEDNLKWREHTNEERSHYSDHTEDLDYNYPFGGFKEMFGLAYRTDFDLKNHMEKSGVDLNYQDPYDNSRKFIPHVVEPTFGINRIFLAVLAESYKKDGDRVYLDLPNFLAPYKIAIFPLLANKQELSDKAKEISDLLSQKYSIITDERGNIGKRYFTQDEIGTPFCVTIDFDSLKDNAVTVRDRNTAKQERIDIDKLDEFFNTKFKAKS